MKRLLYILTIIFLTSVSPAVACSLQVMQRYHEFPEAEFVFIGKVIGFTDAAKASGKSGIASTSAAYGMKVEPTGIVNAPTLPSSHFEVFPLRLEADCSRTGSKLQDLQKLYPIGTELRVVMMEAVIFADGVPDGVVRLEQMIERGGSLLKNGDAEGRFKTTVDAFFDYRSLTYDPKSADAYQQRCLIEFELRKDLNRLEVAKTRAERQSIMKRLRFAPDNTDFDLKLIRFYYKN